MSGVADIPDRQRYELATDGGGVAYAAYRREGGAIVFTHTIVPAEAQGHGVGTRLIEGALADARARGLNVVPECPFVTAYLEQHPG